ncbi:MAG: sigma 54-interacting transcriptional regulator, partial [Bdellovibrionota bacterium]
GAHASKAGLFETAGRGALFLDEIQSLKPELQTKLLRVLETRRFRRLGAIRETPFEGRLLCAANVSLAEKVEKGEFREDLFHRIAAVILRVPPLRLRADDVLELTEIFLKDFDPRSTKRFDTEALAFLASYDWPGNVRELKGLVRTLTARVPYPTLGLAEVKEQLTAWEKPQETTDSSERSGAAAGFAVDWSEGLDANVLRLEEWMIRKTLEKSSGNEARERLQLKRSRFYEKLKLFGLFRET